ncbi:hypothetical protein DOY81_009258, partial [Sarcophaga bullata]
NFVSEATLSLFYFEMLQNFFLKILNYSVLLTTIFCQFFTKMFPINNFFGFNTQNMELYPRRRPTEFYCEPQPMVEYQSRQGEHPLDKLHSNGEAVNWQHDVDSARISPP